MGNTGKGSVINSQLYLACNSHDCFMSSSFHLLLRAICTASIARASLAICACVIAEALCCHFDGKPPHLGAWMVSWQSRGLLWPGTVINSGGNGSDDDGDETREFYLSHPVWEVKHVFIPQWLQSIILDHCDTHLVQVTTHYYNHSQRALAFFHSKPHSTEPISSGEPSYSVSLEDFCMESEFLPLFGFACTSDSQLTLLPPTHTILAVFVPFQFLEHPVPSSHQHQLLRYSLCLEFSPWLFAWLMASLALHLDRRPRPPAPVFCFCRFFHFLPRIFSPTIIMNLSSGFFVIADLQF